MSGGFFESVQVNQSSQNESQSTTNQVARSVRTLLLSQVNRAVIENESVLVDLRNTSQAVLCVFLKSLETTNNGAKILYVSDTTGDAQLKYRSLDPEKEPDHYLDSFVNNYVKAYGQFRIFNDTISFDVSRLELVQKVPEDLALHEIEATREWFHVEGTKPLQESSTIVENDSELFVRDSNYEVEVKIKEFLKNNSADSTRQRLIADLMLEEDLVNDVLVNMQNKNLLNEIDGKLYLSK